MSCDCTEDFKMIDEFGDEDTTFSQILEPIV